MSIGRCYALIFAGGVIFGLSRRWGKVIGAAMSALGFIALSKAEDYAEFGQHLADEGTEEDVQGDAADDAEKPERHGSGSVQNPDEGARAEDQVRGRDAGVRDFMFGVEDIPRNTVATDESAVAKGEHIGLRDSADAVRGGGTGEKEAHVGALLSIHGTAIVPENADCNGAGK